MIVSSLIRLVAVMEYFWSKTNYKLMQGKWKIGILLEAGYQIVPLTEKSEKYVKITDHIYFYPLLMPYPYSQTMSEEEQSYFCDGLKLAAPYISIPNQHNCRLIIALRNIQFSSCNIQEEAFTACAIQWASETFHFGMPEIQIFFDNQAGRNGIYVFDFSSV